MLKKIFVSILIVATTSQALAVECPNATYLKIGDVVKDCDRIGLSKEYDLGLRKELIESDYNKQVIVEQKKLLDLKDISISVYEQKSDLWKSEAERERTQLDKERDRNGKYFWLGILSGIGLTLGAAWAVGQVSR